MKKKYIHTNHPFNDRFRHGRTNTRREREKKKDRKSTRNLINKTSMQHIGLVSNRFGHPASQLAIECKNQIYLHDSFNSIQTKY